MTWPRTLADAEDIARLHLVRPYPADAPLPRTARVRCPSCGARVPADAVRDLHALQGTTCRPLGRGRITDVGFACDGCYELVIAEPSNGWTRSRMVRALGAPAAAVREVRAAEIAAERSGISADPLQELERARAALPRGRRDLPGTAAPSGQGAADGPRET